MKEVIIHSRSYSGSAVIWNPKKLNKNIYDMAEVAKRSSTDGCHAIGMEPVAARPLLLCKLKMLLLSANLWPGKPWRGCCGVWGYKTCLYNTKRSVNIIHNGSVKRVQQYEHFIAWGVCPRAKKKKQPYMCHTVQPYAAVRAAGAACANEPFQLWVQIGQTMVFVELQHTSRF